MPRPMKGRRVCCLPRNNRFGPLGQGRGRAEGEIMTVDEYEAIRLIDYMNFTQEECAQQMKVARTTVQGIYDQARKKLARCLVDGKPLTITGGAYLLYGGKEEGGNLSRGACSRHRRGQRAFSGTGTCLQEETPASDADQEKDRNF
ncbi:MAG: DUF134 domain-containing protein [Bacillota bacterium]|nr:DUF134 domain-containing protein [Bacillota bacterium]